MFHSSGLRHEQYLIRSKSKQSKATLQTNRISLESNASGTDSGYASTTSSVPSTVSGKDKEKNSTSVTSHVIMTTDRSSDMLNNTNAKQGKDCTALSLHTTSSSITTNTNSSTANSKKKRFKTHTAPRQPDLVYACPRPLTFPFHNDDQFLPIAEADPRDVARISPSTNRLMNGASSLRSSNSNKTSLSTTTSVGSTKMFDSSSYSSSTYKGVYSKQTLLDSSAATSTHSRRSSVLGSIQQGTVRSLRSLFQLPNYSLNMIGNSKNCTTIPIQKLEIKRGTVQSIREMFSKKRESFTQLQPSSLATLETQTSTVAIINQFETNNESNKKDTLAAPTKARKFSAKSFNDRVAVAFRKKKTSPPMPATASVMSKATSSAPVSMAPNVQPIRRSKLRNTVESVKERVTILTQTFKSTLQKPPNDNNIGSNQPLSSQNLSCPQNNDKKGIFSVFKRQQKYSNPSPSVYQNEHPHFIIDDYQTDAKTKKTDSVPVTLPSAPASTVVNKLWKGFKKLVTRRKTSRVGVL